MCDEIYICRHGETEWTLSGQHTGTTDLPLTAKGEEQVKHLGKVLQSISFDHVLASPLKRVGRTCELAGFDDVTVDPDLVEWNYGDYEGITSVEIHKDLPDWNVFTYGSPGGESVADIQQRADRVIERLRGLNGRVLVFSSGHFSRALAGAWTGLGVGIGRHLDFGVAAIAVLFTHRGVPMIKHWNIEVGR